MRGSTPLFLAGVNHRTAPAGLRERGAFLKEKLAAALGRLKALGMDAVVLSTRERTEVYAASRWAGLGPTDLSQFLADLSGLSACDIMPHLYHLEQEEVARHLFRLAAGLDSPVGEEHQALGLVRGAYLQAHKAMGVGDPLHSLFCRAIRLGKLIRRDRELERAEALVEGAVAEFMAWLAAEERAPIVADLWEWADGIRRAELRRAMSRLGRLSEPQRQVVASLSSSIVNKLLHQPIVALESSEEGAAYAETVRALFGLDAKGTQAEARPRSRRQGKP